MSDQQISEALNNCIDRLADGERIEDCLRDYPEIADELGALLKIGQASSLNRAGNRELNQMHSRLDAEMAALIEETDFNRSSPFRLPPGLMVLVASLLLVVFGLFLFFPQQSNPTGVQSIETASPVMASETAEIMPSETKCPAPEDWIAYEVKPGDSITTVANDYNISVTSLLVSNCLNPTDTIEEGQLIFVPPTPDDDDD